MRNKIPWMLLSEKTPQLQKRESKNGVSPFNSKGRSIDANKGSSSTDTPVLVWIVSSAHL